MRKLIIAILAIVMGVAVWSTPVMAGSFVNTSGSSGSACDIEGASGTVAGCGSTSTLDKVLVNLVNIALTVIGIVAVFVIVMGGQRYITSGGDPAKAKAAKDMILYAVIGLIVALLSWAIISMVAQTIGGGGSGGSGSGNNSSSSEGGEDGESSGGEGGSDSGSGSGGGSGGESDSGNSGDTGLVMEVIQG